MFGSGVGLLDGKYHIVLDETVTPVQHSPRRVPVPLRDVLKSTLDNLVLQNILAPVQKPTPWISSMVAVPKKDGLLRICLDPRDLNRAIRREHFPLPTIEDVATRLHGAKVFSVLDVRKGFWHVELDEESSLLTTFSTPFGRYRWKRMPFGICSAPEVFQRRMYDLIHSLQGVEVVADDFVVVGFGDTPEVASRDHDKNLEQFLQRCAERGVKLNSDKVKLRSSELPFIGHVATDQGLCVDPMKIQAITEMPPPTDVKGVQRLLGMALYLAKFVPHISDITKPLRDLTQKNIAWVWDQPQEKAFQELRQVVSSTPTLRYYNLAEEVTLQCDASQTGLGAALMQNGQPVAYASRALADAETRYAQIEKELLAIVCACDRFHAYIYGRNMVNVESDHQPLEMIMRKSLNDAPKRLQRMLLQLQRYSLRVSYKRGSQMHLADTLSRAYISEVDYSVEFAELAEIDHTMLLSLAPEDIQRLQHASQQDMAIQELSRVICQGWPASKSEVPDAARPYYDFRDELTVQDPLVFKGPVVVIPAALRAEMMAKCHATHIGMEGCLRRDRESMYWPRMSTDLKEYMSKCDVCLSHQSLPQRETIQQHEIIARPWAKVGVDLCDLHGRTLLVVCDYFSGFIEVERLQSTTTAPVSKALMVLFARYGVPMIVMSDNGPQFSSMEFRSFARTWGFQHITSSPRYPQSNGKAENAVKTIKRLFTKCREAKGSEYQALLDWRNTPTEGVGSSPAQHFFGRRCRTLMPLTEVMLRPSYEISRDAKALLGKKTKQAYYYNRQARDLPPITTGEIVRMQLPGEKRWTPGTCTGPQGPRSFGVRVGDTEYRRNRRQLLQRQEVPELPEPEQTVSHETTSNDDSSDPEKVEQPTDSSSVTPNRPLRRSTRQTKPPEWITTYVPS